jgi:iron complex outermembrane receptor protein
MLEVRRTFDQDDVAVNETPTDGYTLVNASFGYRFDFGSRILDLLVRGRNLTDEEARSHTSFLKQIAPLPGRDLSVGLRLWF